MNVRPLYRLTLFLLPALLLCNILLFAWFARKARETSAAEVVQKAYIVSRMLSTLSSRSLEREELSPLKRVLEEAFKDKHIVSVTIIDKDGDVIIQSTLPGTHAQLSTFETPIIVGEKSVATLVTSFSMEESEEIIGGRLRATAWLQAALLAAIALALAWLCRREKLAAAHPAIAPEMPTPIASAAAERQESGAGLAGERLVRINGWQLLALQGGANAHSLIDSAREIVAMVQAGEAEGGAGVEERGGVTAELDGVICAAEELLLALKGDGGRLLSPDDSVIAAAALVREGVETMRQRVFPALAAAVGAGETVSARIALLLERVDDCGDRSNELTRRSGELFDLADGLRLLRRELSATAGGEGAEGGLNLLAERVESIADSLKRESRELLGAANGATAAGRAILTSVEESRERLLAAGSTVEDAAASSVMGSDHLRRFLAGAGVGDGEATPADGEELKGALQELLGRMALLRQEQALPAPPLPEQSGGSAQSLLVACENLLLASRFLGEIASSASGLGGEETMACEPGEGEPGRQGRSADRLIAAANANLALCRSRMAAGGSAGAEE